MTDRSAWFYGIVTGAAQGPGPVLIRAGLWWARWPYALAVWTRNRGYDVGLLKVHRPITPVVSVGNLSLGGTGKTPCVEYVASHYSSQGWQVAILSRGYGSEHGRNDEAMVLEDNLPDVPHLQGADRVDLAHTAVEELERDLLILDDGFQHRRLGRSLDIVLVDATRPPDRDWLFPRGTLREPGCELRRADQIVLTRCDQADDTRLSQTLGWLARRRPDLSPARTIHAPVALLATGAQPTGPDVLAGQKVGGFCGIGNPEAFRRTLLGLGAEIVAFRTFSDHHQYTRDDVEDLSRWAGTLPAGAWLVTTQKDLVKLQIPELGGVPLKAVKIGLCFLDGEAEFCRRLDAVGVDLPA